MHTAANQATFTLEIPGIEHGLHGQISEVARGDKGPRFTRYSIRMTPSLQRLEHRRNRSALRSAAV